MRKILGKSITRVGLVMFALAACRGQNMPASPTPLLSPSAATAVLTPVGVSGTTLQANQAEITQIMDMSFIDADRGWLIAATYYQSDETHGIAIRRTIDGGISWTPVSAPDAQPGDEITGTNIVHQIRFVDGQTGWIFGPGLFVTRDGGQTWQEVQFLGGVAALGGAGPGGPVWAVGQTCLEAWDCSLQLFETTPAEPDHWVLVAPIPGRGELLVFRPLDAKTAALLVRVSVNTPSGSQVDLLLTRDGGRTWKSFTTPCLLEALLAAVDSSHWFLLCSSIPSAGQQPKAFFQSTDSGKTWVQILGWYSEELIYGYGDAMLFLSPRDGMIGMGRASVIRTVDGGKNWISAIPIDQGEGGWSLAALGERDVWAGGQNMVFYSRDGGSTWKGTDIH